MLGLGLRYVGSWDFRDVSFLAALPPLVQESRNKKGNGGFVWGVWGCLTRSKGKPTVTLGWISVLFST